MRLSTEPPLLIPQTAEDEAFLAALYAQTREAEVAAWGWSEEAAREFLQMQFQAQQRAYAVQYPAAEHRVIWRDGQRLGRLIVQCLDDEIRLVDIALSSEARNCGIGSGLLRRLQSEAASSEKPLRLQVLATSPARRLYQRLGFDAVGGDELRVAMEWRVEGNDHNNRNNTGERNG